MNMYIFTVLLLFIGLFSCHKEEILINKKDVIDPATKVNNALISGRVIYDDEGVANAEIFIYQKGMMLGKVVSDQGGYYSTEGVELEIGYDVTFEIKSTELSINYKRITIENQKYENINFIMFDKGTGNLKFSPLPNPGDTSLVLVYGTLKNIYGDPIVGAFCSVRWGFYEVQGLSWKSEGINTVTDENGYFELLVNQDVELYFYSVLFIGNSSCGSFLNFGEYSPSTNPFAPKIYQNVGKIYSDFEIMGRDDLEVEKSETTIVGKFLNCSGNPATNGVIKHYFVTELENGLRLYRQFNSRNIHFDGSFKIKNGTCHIGEHFIHLRFINSDSLGTTIDIPYKKGEIDIGTVRACDDFHNTPSFMTIKIGDLYSSDKIPLIKEKYLKGLHLEGKRIINSTSYWLSKHVISDKAKLGENVFSLFSFGNIEPWGFKAENGEIKINITEITTNRMSGTFQGEVETNGNGIQKVTGTINFCDR